MKVVSKDDEKMVVELTLDEARMVLGLANEALDGQLAYPVEDWEEYISQPRSLADSLADDFLDALRK